MSKPFTPPLKVVENYFEQLRHAQRMMQQHVQSLLDRGYVYDPALGCYTSKDGNTQVWLDG